MNPWNQIVRRIERDSIGYKDTSLETMPSKGHQENRTPVYLKRLERFEIYLVEKTRYTSAKHSKVKGE